MASRDQNLLTKLRWSLPWVVRYPFWTMEARLQQISNASGPRHMILIVANHFEPSWNVQCLDLERATQQQRVDDWCKQARAIGRAVRDFDGTPFRHTYFYPGEQYDRSLLESLAELQAEGLGEVEIHLHHGIRRPDTASNLKRTLEGFRDVLAEEHRFLSRLDGAGTPMYGFVHGNLALANSRGGRFCGVDSEMQILAETGCYADFTLPAGLTQAQVPRINAIYQCGHPLHEPRPHRSGPNLRVGDSPVLPILFTGPLVFDWRGRRRLLPVPTVEDGVLSANRPLSLNRFRHWLRSGIGIRGRPDWSFIKLYCHGFFPQDQPAMIGTSMRRFLDEVLDFADRTGEFKVHFTTAREAFNMAMAAVDGQSGEPNLYRDYRLRQIMHARPDLPLKNAAPRERFAIWKAGSTR